MGEIEDLSEEEETGDFVSVTSNGEYVTLRMSVDEDDFDKVLSFDGNIFGWQR